MNHPLDQDLGELLKAASEGPEAMEDWLKNLQEKVGAPDGPELPDEIELEYADGTKETIDTTFLPKFYSHDNPAPQEVIDRWNSDEDE